MNQDAVIEEVRRVLSPLLPDGPVDVAFRHDYQPREDDKHYTSGGDPTLEFFISPGDDSRHPAVHITRVGDCMAVETLPTAPVPESDGLPDEVWVKDDPFRSDYDEHLPQSAQHYGLYTHICQQLKPSAIMEIGVRGGYSAWAMLQAAPNATYLGIDLNQGTWGGEVDYIHDAVDMLRRTYPQADIVVLEGDSQTITSLPRSFDVIHIDGHHGHEQVLHDLELCLPYAEHLIVDDVDFVTTVRSGVSQFLANHPTIKAVHYESWRGLVLISTREVKREGWVVDLPGLFETPETVKEARDIILMPDGGIDTDTRWRVETPWLLERMIFPPGLLLDVGCAIGRLSAPLAQRRDHAVLGIESSAKMRRLAMNEVDLPDRFVVTTQPFLAKLVAGGLRAQGALALWVFQHMPPDQLSSMVQLLWQALDPGALLFTLDRERCVPISKDGVRGWWNDHFDMWGLLEREGFMLHTVEEPPRTACGSGVALRRWIRRR